MYLKFIWQQQNNDTENLHQSKNDGTENLH